MAELGTPEVTRLLGHPLGPLGRAVLGAGGEATTIDPDGGGIVRVSAAGASRALAVAPQAPVDESSRWWGLLLLVAAAAAVIAWVGPLADAQASHQALRTFDLAFGAPELVPAPSHRVGGPGRGAHRSAPRAVRRARGVVRPRRLAPAATPSNPTASQPVVVPQATTPAAAPPRAPVPTPRPRPGPEPQPATPPGPQPVTPPGDEGGDGVIELVPVR